MGGLAALAPDLMGGLAGLAPDNRLTPDVRLGVEARAVPSSATCFLGVLSKLGLEHPLLIVAAATLVRTPSMRHAEPMAPSVDRICLSA